jgi:hypothetical protein
MIKSNFKSSELIINTSPKRKLSISGTYPFLNDNNIIPIAIDKVKSIPITLFSWTFSFLPSM